MPPTTTQLLATHDQQTAQYRQYWDDFHRIQEYGPDGSEFDDTLVRAACALVCSYFHAADAEIEGA